MQAQGVEPDPPTDYDLQEAKVLAEIGACEYLKRLMQENEYVDNLARMGYLRDIRRSQDENVKESRAETAAQKMAGARALQLQIAENEKHVQSMKKQLAEGVTGTVTALAEKVGLSPQHQEQTAEPLPVEPVDEQAAAILERDEKDVDLSESDGGP